MVNDLRDQLHGSVAAPPHDPFDVRVVLEGGRRRTRRRRGLRLAGAALATAAVVGVGSLVLGNDTPPDLAAAGVPEPAAPTLRLSDATPAVEGTDYRVLASHTNDDLDRDNGQYFEGVTDDGLILFRDGPRMGQLRPRYALLDPATGTKEWLPESGSRQSTGVPVALGSEELVLLATAGGASPTLVALVFDRELGRWSDLTWPGLPPVEDVFGTTAVHEGRLYVGVPASQGQPPEGGWPTSPGGDAEDADADGDTYRLWSASLSDPADVRDEGLTLGDLAFTDSSMVWTDSTNGESGLVHVRDLATGQERAFDPRSGERCNLLAFGATDDRVVMSQYCGTYDDGVRDDRVQVIDTDGGQVVTVQGSGIDGALTSVTGTGAVTVTSYEDGGEGTYVYDLESGRFLRLSEDVSSWTTSGPTQDRQLLWNTPENRGNGMTQHLGELLD